MTHGKHRRCSVCRSFLVLITVISTTVLTLPLHAQQMPADVVQAFRDLQNDAVVMDLSAHPDDEDGAGLAYYHYHEGAKTYSVLFTRGEGGQNEKGPELYEELGVIRSRETRAAGAILGTEVEFLNFLDFGFSKTATETFRIWGGQEETLRRLVYGIREFKPDILFTNHNTIDGHGNHQAVAITAIAAFDAAADSTMFPEQLREPGISLWQPRKLFFRAFGRMEGPVDASVPILDVDSLQGKSYIDIASEALHKHESQGMARADLRRFIRGRSTYRLVRSNSLYAGDTTNFLAGINLWADTALAPLLPLRENVRALHPGMPVDSLLVVASEVEQALHRIDEERNSLAGRIVLHWRESLDRVVEAATGLKISAILADTVVVPTQRVGCSVSVEGVHGLGDVRWSFHLPSGWSINERQDAAPQTSSRADRRLFELTVGGNAAFTLPHVKMQYASLYRHQNVDAVLSCTIKGHPLSFTVPVHFDVAPRQTITATPPVAAFIAGRTPSPMTFAWRVHNWLPKAVTGNVSIAGPAGWTSKAHPFAIAAEDGEAAGEIALSSPAGVKPGEYVFHVKTGYCSTDVRVQVFDVAVASHTNLGIVESYDNTLEQAAHDLHLPYTMLDDAAIEKGDLSQYSCIILDIRAYLVRDALKSHNTRFLEYVNNGGTLLVMYQRDQEWKPEYAPYPFRITRNRVTMEDAPVTVLEPSHPLMVSPNRIGKSDWEGWKQERGLYFPGDVPSEYTRLLSCSDSDEPPLTTGYLVAPYGRGAYIYTSYVWYRQLKEALPGAYRCFANMISYHPAVK